ALIRLDKVRGILHLHNFGPFVDTEGLANISFQVDLADSSIRDGLWRAEPKVLAAALADAARSLRKVHKLKWIHRDINRSNLMMVSGKSARRPDLRYGDFGLAECVDLSGYGEHLAGTRGYMDPYYAERRVNGYSLFRTLPEGVAADVFALGVAFAKAFYQDKRCPLFDLIYQCNLSSLPLKHTAASTPKQSYARYKEGYFAALKQHPHMRGLEKLLWKMMHPEPKQRPNLRAVEWKAWKIYKS
ncbi:MAG: serine/threonine-protein kinase, partial [Zetaproteobacteria bacterium]|nr:serine/threonine-protein kinase [Zetaproteobacteria bacterium]